MIRFLLAALLVGCENTSPPLLPQSNTDLPVITLKEPFFSNKKELLSTFTTEFDANEINRTNNIVLATKLLDGTIVKPGDKFSFNKTVGKRTEKRGFKKATVLFMGTKQLGLGGGICQVSSTLYAAAMYGGLKVTHRTSHSRPSNYIAKGLDATVSYPNLDLRFVNIYDDPITINSHTDGNKLTVKILGVKNPFTKVTHVFKLYKPTEFNQRFIKAPYLKNGPKKIQSGKYGKPGVSYWLYKPENKSIKVRSEYKPVPEVWYFNPNKNVETFNE